jgi:mRNA interferase MazF
MTCEPGDLALIPFPYSDLTAYKKGLVLALTGPDRHGDFIALAVTSVEQTEKGLSLTASELCEGVLPKPSWIRLDKVFTLSVASIAKVIGHLEPQTLERAIGGLCRSVGYDRR